MHILKYGKLCMPNGHGLGEMSNTVVLNTFNTVVLNTVVLNNRYGCDVIHNDVDATEHMNIISMIFLSAFNGSFHC